MSIQISGSNLTTGLNNTVLSPPYGSLSFNGVNQSVVTSGTGSGANNTALDITTGSPSYTIEFWIYTSQYSRITAPQYFLNQGNGQVIQFRVMSGNDKSYVTYGTNYLSIAFYSSTLGWITMDSWPTTMTLNTWYHVALCKDTSNGNCYYLYLNGVLVSSTPSITGLAVNQGQPWEIGFPPTYITSDPQYAFNGLLSNIRVVKGQALYVPPVVSEPSLPLSATQSLNLSGYNQAITGTQTSLLLTTPNTPNYLTDTSSYAQTVTGVNTPTSSPLGPTTGSSINGSISLNGTSQYLTAPNNVAFSFGTGDFTIEAWINPISVDAGANQFTIISFGNNVLSLYISSGTLYYYDTNTGGPGNVAGGTVVINQWQHIAVTRNGTSVKCYINGVQAISTTSSSNITSGTNYIGFNGGSYPWGYISNLRVVKGVAVYTSNFTPSTSPLTSTQSANQNGNPSTAITGTQTSLLLNTTNNSNYLKDSSTNNFTITSTGSPTSTGLNPFVPGSILFDGVNQYLTIAAATQFNYSTNDFTWEMWIYPTSSTWTTDIMYFIDHGPQANQGSLHYIANRLVYYNYYNAGTVPPYASGEVYPSLYTIGGGSIPANTWTHIAVCRQNLVTNMFINGQVVSTGPDSYNYATVSGSPYSNPIVSPATQSVIIGARTDGNYPFKGNISNVRIVNGVSVYNVGNFTPPVQPLPAVQAPNTIGSPSKAIFGSQTSLLVNSPYNSNFLTDGSFNGVTLTQQTTGQYPRSTYTLSNNSTNPFNSNGSIFTPGSIFFNGSSQYLSVASTPTLALSTSDFTVECWVNWSSLTTSAIIDNQSSGGFSLYYDAGVYLSNYLVVSNRIVNQLTYPWVPALNTWYHIAIARFGTTIRMFINGVLVTSATGNTTDYQAGIYQIGADLGPGAGGWYLNGYLSNLRIVKGAAAYTQSFIPTSGPFTNNQTFNQSGIPSCPVQSSQTSLLLTTPSNSSYLTDSSTNAFTVTNNGTATSNPFNPFSENYTILSNPGSVSLNGTTQYLTIPDNAAFVFSGDFTMEAWIYPTSFAGTNGNAIATQWPGAVATDCAWQFFISSTGKVGFVYGIGATNLSVTGTSLSCSLNSWTHVAVTRSGSTVKFFVNGVADATTPTVSGSLNDSTSVVNVGRINSTDLGYFTGYISNLRLVNGLAVYTSNFTPPPGPLNNSQAANQSGAPSAAVTSSQTSLLLNTAFGTNFLVDSSINNLTITNVGTATSSTLDPFVF